MNAVAKKIEVRVGMSPADRARLTVLCARLEMNTSEVLRYYIRQAYAALGERVELVGPSQMGLFPTVLPDGKTPFPIPIPKAPPQVIP